MKFTHLQIDDVSYKVLDSKARRCATFEYIDAPDRKLPAGVHLDLDVRSWVTDKILMVNAKKADMLYLVGIYEYVMEVSMQFAYGRGRSLCIIHSLGELNNLVYAFLAERLDPKKYKVNIYGYGRRIEIRKTGKKK